MLTEDKNAQPKPMEKGTKKSLSFGESHNRKSPMNRRLHLKTYNTASPSAESTRSSLNQFTSSPSFSQNLQNQTSSPTVFNSLQSPHHRRSTLIELRTRTENGYRLFAPMRAFLDPTFSDFGNYLKETMKILDLFQQNLNFLSLEVSDIALISISVTNETLGGKVKETVQLYFGKNLGNAVIEVNEVPSIADDCCVELQASVFEKQVAMLSPRTSQKVENLKRYETKKTDILSSASYAQTDNKYRNILLAFGDVLPVTLAQGYGFYGEPVERLSSAIQILTYVRVVMCIFSVIVFVPLLNFILSKDENNNLRTGPLYKSTIFLIIIGFLLLIQCGILAGMGLTFRRKGQLAFKQFANATYYGDQIMFLLLLSALCSVSPLVSVIITAQEDSASRRQYKRSISFGFILLGCIVFAYVLDRKVFSLYQRYGERLPFREEASSSVVETR
eukprot:maker-scaffold_1-snap-gene-32.44-mRNA-1 protein AED:0.00 eAED:0.00 QI:63/1/1/1/0/0.33/3/135/445